MTEDSSQQEPGGRSPLQALNTFKRRASEIMARWWEQPIGVIVPLVALVILLLAPQSADMFAAIDDAASAIGFALAAFALAFSCWYWTRAGLFVMDETEPEVAGSPIERRKTRQKNPPESWTDKDWEEWADERAPRLAVLLFCLLIAAAPFFVRVFGAPLTRTTFGYPLAASALAIVAVFFVYVVALTGQNESASRFYERMRRRLGMREGAAPRAGAKRWNFETSSVFASAPFGPRLAFLLVAISLLGVAVIAYLPGLVDHVDAPAAALLALAMAVPLLVIALAVARDVVRGVLTVAVFFWGWLFHRGRWPWKTLWERKAARDMRGLTAGLGTALLAAIIFTPYLYAGQRGLYEIRRAACLAESGCPGAAGQEQVLEGPRPTAREAIETWHRARLDAGHPADMPMPAIIVSASGGASRAAFWLLSSMQMLDERTGGGFGKYLFGISGVSGGSLGAVTYLHMLRTYPGAGGAGVDWKLSRGKLGDFQKSDFLVASISTYFVNDTIRPILHLVPGVNAAALLPDRGEALERAFERHWADANRLAIPKAQAEGGLIQVWQGGGPGMPHFFLNGTDVDTGRRLITSTIRFANDDDLFAGSEDLLALLGHDVPASTAVTNSARFPFISPAGRFWNNGEPRQVVDGGYFENYGARTAAELAGKIEQISADMVADAGKAGRRMAPIVPILVVISNDAEGLRTAGDVAACESERPDDPCRTIEEATVSCDRPAAATTAADAAPSERGGGFGPEGLAPLLGLYATRGAHGQDALHIMRRRYCPAEAQPGSARRMIHIALPRPKPEAGESAPLNWVLNKSTIDFLLAAPAFDFNSNQAEHLRTTLSGLLQSEPAVGEISSKQ